MLAVKIACGFFTSPTQNLEDIKHFSMKNVEKNSLLKEKL
jgi:hypothetical protein